MLHCSQQLLNWRAKRELALASRMLFGRARNEAKLGHRVLTNTLKHQSLYRVEEKAKYVGSVTRQGLNAAYLEHGTDYGAMRSDLARHNVQLTNATLHNLALYEPLALRALVELAASEIPPPPPPTHTENTAPDEEGVRGELRRDIARMLAPASALRQNSAPTAADADRWMSAWEDFDVARPKAAAAKP